MRTAIGALCPANPAGHKAPALVLESTGDRSADARRYLTFAALFCSLPFDYVVRNKLFSKSFGSNTLGQIPMPPPRQVIPQENKPTSLQAYIQKLALELPFTSWSLKELGEAVGRSRPFTWNAERRFLMLREADAATAHFFKLDKEELEYVISTFQTLEKDEVAKYGSFRTREIVLRCYDAMSEAIASGQPYQSLLDPLPVDLDLPAGEPRHRHTPPPAHRSGAISTAGDRRRKEGRLRRAPRKRSPKIPTKHVQSLQKTLPPNNTDPSQPPPKHRGSPQLTLSDDRQPNLLDKNDAGPLADRQAPEIPNLYEAAPRPPRLSPRRPESRARAPARRRRPPSSATRSSPAKSAAPSNKALNAEHNAGRLKTDWKLVWKPRKK